MNESAHDGQLISLSLAEGEHFADLFDRHYAAVHGFAARRLGRDQADDLAAEVFARAFKTRDKFDVDRADASPWLFGIASNLIRMHARGESRKLRAYARTGVDPIDDFVSAADDRAFADAHSRELMRAVARLSKSDREVLLLHAWADLSLAQIAEALSVPEGTVRSRMHRARKKLESTIPGPPAGAATTAATAEEAAR